MNNKADIREIVSENEKEQISRGILLSLPHWFGIPESTKAYIRECRHMTFWAAFIEEKPAGFLAVKAHNSYSAELYVMGVLEQFHRQGVGTSLFSRCLEWARQRGYEYLQVKTLDESHPDPFYAKTRKYYQAMGFRPLECFSTVWGESCPCLVMVLHIPSICSDGLSSH